MAKGKNLLTVTAVRAACRPSENVKRHSDGHGLMLVVSPSGSGKWVLRIQKDGRRQDIGLGSANDVSLGGARELADNTRKKVMMGRDVVSEKKAQRERAKAGTNSFEDVARIVHRESLPTWKNRKHAAQWISTLEAYVFPKFGKLHVDQVTGPIVRDTLAEIWIEKPETARRVRQRISTVIDWAVAKGLREHELNLRAITKGLPKQKDKASHHAAMPYEDVPSFIASLQGMHSVSAAVRLSLEFTILTASRSGETRLARWSEFDLEARRWDIPARRMKAGEPHTVPLTDRAVEIIKEALELRRDDSPDALVFEGTKRNTPLSDMTLSAVLRRNKLPYTPHGFRSSFRDWTSEQTGFGRDLAEMSLAHKVGDKTERAYARSNLLERRRDLMAAWAVHCSGGSGNVVLLPTRERIGLG